MNETAPSFSLIREDDTRPQYGALCWRRKEGRVEVLLITSRDTGRWVIPKGWPMAGVGPDGVAAREAFEEAGVQGELSGGCVGLYSYDKALCRREGRESSVPCVVAVYPVRVDRLVDKFPEANQRRRKWFAADKAARRVAEPELQALLAGFTPDDALAAPGTA